MEDLNQKKKTKLGIDIPNGWQVHKLGELLHEVKVHTSDLAKYPLYSFTIEKGVCPKSDRYNREHLLKDKEENEYRVIAPNQFIYNPMNLRFGAFGRSKIEFPVSVSAYYNILEAEKKDMSDFLEYYLKSERLLSIYNRISIGSLEEKKRVHLSMFLDIEIPLPSFKEFEKIGKIIDTWETAIIAQENLIVALIERKKGLLQQLLSGRKRLNGYNDEWLELKGSDLFANCSNKNHNGELEVLSATQDRGVIPRSETGIDIKYDKASLKSYKQVDIGDFVISLRSFQGGIEYSNYIGIVSAAYTVLKEKREISKQFYQEYLKSGDFIGKLNSIIYGIRDGKQISYKEFGTIKIWYPPLEEQIAISKVFETINNEIRTQREKLKGLYNQRQGIMQQLLTGQKRVKL